MIVRSIILRKKDDTTQLVVKQPEGMAKISSSPSAFVEFFRGLQSKTYLCDVAFIVGDENAEVYGIKAILCARSSVFASLFHLQAIQTNSKKSKGSSTQKKKFMHFLRMPLYTKEEFSMLMEYVHCGICHIGPKNVIGLFVAADEFNMINLKRCCVNFLGQNLSLDNVVYILSELERFQSRDCAIELEPLVFNYIRVNAEKVLSEATVAVLSKAQMIQLFCLEGLQLPELNKFQAALIWTKAQARNSKGGSNSLQSTFAPFLNCIKLTKIPIQHLVDDVRRSKVVPERVLAHACAYNEFKDSFQSAQTHVANSTRKKDENASFMQPFVVGMQVSSADRPQKNSGKKLIKSGKNRYDVSQRSFDDLDSDLSSKPRLTKTKRTLSSANMQTKPRFVSSSSRPHEPLFTSFNPKAIRTSRSSRLLISSSTEGSNGTPSRPRLTKSSKVSTPLLDIMF